MIEHAFSDLNVIRRDNVIYATINQIERLNSITESLLTDLDALITTVELDPSIKALLSLRITPQPLDKGKVLGWKEFRS